jgi:hypothetical protein
MSACFVYEKCSTCGHSLYGTNMPLKNYGVFSGVSTIVTSINAIPRPFRGTLYHGSGLIISNKQGRIVHWLNRDGVFEIRFQLGLTPQIQRLAEHRCGDHGVGETVEEVFLFDESLEDDLGNTPQMTNDTECEIGGDSEEVDVEGAPIDLLSSLEEHSEFVKE